MLHINGQFYAGRHHVGKVLRSMLLASHEMEEKRGKVKLTPAERFKVYLRGHDAAKLVSESEMHTVETATHRLAVRVESISRNGEAGSPDEETEVVLKILSSEALDTA